MDEFVYLGTLVTCGNDVNWEVKRKIGAAKRAFDSVTSTEIKLYKTLILTANILEDARFFFEIKNFTHVYYVDSIIF